MIDKTRKRFSPMLLVMSLAVVGVLAAFIAVAGLARGDRSPRAKRPCESSGLRGHDHSAAGDP